MDDGEDRSNFGLAGSPRSGLRGRHLWEWGVKAAPWGRRRQREANAASPAEATEGSAGRSLLSGLSQRPIPTATPRPLTLWILFRAMVGNGGDGPRGGDGDGGGTGKGRGGPETARAVASRPEKTGSSEARIRRAEGRGPLSYWACRSGHRITRRRPLYALLPQPPPP